MDITASYTKEHVHGVTMSHAEKVASILKWTYGIVPIVAGADKFLHLLTNWDKYLAPQIASILPVSPNAFMNVIGIIEIVAGILLFIKPRIGSLIVCFWLVGISVNLVVGGEFLDVAIRDLVMAIGAFSLYILSRKM